MLAVVLALALGQTAERLKTIDGECLWWRDRSFTWTADAPDAGEYEAVDRALAEWRSKIRACSGFELPPAARVADAGVGKGPSTVVFRQRLCSSVVPANDPCLDDDTCGNLYHCWSGGASVIDAALITYVRATGEILDVDVELNATVAFDVETLMASNTGHALGLAYVDDPSSVMHRGSPLGMVRRTVDAASAAMICSTYPLGEPPRRCDGGTVVLDAGTRLDAGTPCNPSAAVNGCNASERCRPVEGEPGRYTCQTPSGCGCSTGTASLLLLAALGALSRDGRSRARAKSAR